MSWGSHVGPHDGTSSFDQALNALVGEKRIVVGSAGNEGSDYLTIDIFETPSVIITGETGSGKSILLDQIILQLINC